MITPPGVRCKQRKFEYRESPPGSYADANRSNPCPEFRWVSGDSGSSCQLLRRAPISDAVDETAYSAAWAMRAWSFSIIRSMAIRARASALSEWIETETA